MKQAVLGSIIVIFLATLYSCQEKLDENTIAKIGGVKIGIAEFRAKLVESNPQRSVGNITLERKETALNEFIDIRARALWAEDSGLDQNVEVQNALTQRKYRGLSIALFNHLVIGELMPDAFLKNYYEWQQYKTVAAMFVLTSNKSEKPNPRHLAAAKKLAVKYAKELKLSETPYKFAGKVTESRQYNAKFNPYNYGKFDFGIDSVVAATPIGEVVGPFLYEGSYFTLKIMERTLRPNKVSFENRKRAIIRLLKPKYKMKEDSLYQFHTLRLEEKYNLGIDNAGIEEFAKVLANWGSDLQKTYKDLNAEERNIRLAEVDGVTFNSGEMIDFYNVRLRQSYKNFTNPENLKSGFLVLQLNTLAWSKEAMEKGLDKNSKLSDDLAQFKINLLARETYRTAVINKTKVPKAEVEATYQKNIADYTLPRSIEAWQIPLQSEEIAKTILEKAKNGVGFEGLYKTYSAIKDPKQNAYYAGYLTLDNQKFSYLTEAVHKAGTHQYIGPIAHNNFFYIVKTGSDKEKSVQPLGLVQRRIESKIYSEKKSAALKKLNNLLNSEYKRTINQQALTELK